MAIPKDQLKKWELLPQETIDTIRDRISVLQQQHATELQLMYEAKEAEKEEKAKIKAKEKAIRAAQRLKIKEEKQQAEDKERELKGLPPKRRTAKKLGGMTKSELQIEMTKNLKYMSKIAGLLEEK